MLRHPSSPDDDETHYLVDTGRHIVLSVEERHRGKAAGTTTFTLSGTVGVGSTPLAGVHFAAPGGASCPDSNGSGNYVCTVPQGWSGTVTPQLSGYSFAPSSRS